MIDKRSWVLYLVLMLVFAATRWPGLMPPNFSAALALMVCTGAFLGRAWFLPMGAMVFTDVALNLHYGAAPFQAVLIPSYVAYALLLVLGAMAGPRASLPRMLGAGLGGAVLFYLITNTAAFLGSPDYPKSPAGWIQALTTGTEGWDETWKFFRNSLASTLLFTSLFTLAWRRHLGFLRREAVALANPPQAG